MSNSISANGLKGPYQTPLMQSLASSLPAASVLLFAAILSYFIAGGLWFLVSACLGLLCGAVLMTRGAMFISLVWLLGIPTGFVLVNNLIQSIPFFTIERGFFCLVVGMLVFQRINGLPATKSRHSQLHPLDRPWHNIERAILILFGIIVASYVFKILLGKYPIRVRKDLAMFYTYGMSLAALIISAHIKWRWKQVELLINLLMATGVFLAGIGIAQNLLGFDWFTPTYMETIHEDRATGTLSNASEYGAVISIFLMITLFQITRSRSALPQLFYLAVMMILLLALVLAKTRAPLIGLAAALAFVFYYDKSVRVLLILGFFLVTGVSIVAVPFLVDLNALTDRMTDLVPIYNRLALWVAAIHMSLKNPVLGVGFGEGSFSQALPDYILSFGPISGQWALGVGIPHNEFLYIASMCGLSGLCIYLVLVRRIFRLLMHAGRSDTHGIKNDEAKLAITLMGIFVGYCVNGLFVDTAKFNYLNGLIYYLIGIYVSRSFRLSDERNQLKLPMKFAHFTERNAVSR